MHGIQLQAAELTNGSGMIHKARIFLEFRKTLFTKYWQKGF
jgi:hypothetical protein